MRTMAIEVGEHGITVNGIAPGMTVTPMNRTIFTDLDRREKNAEPNRAQDGRFSAGHRQHGGLPGQRRRQLLHRQHLFRRRRLDADPTPSVRTESLGFGLWVFGDEGHRFPSAMLLAPTAVLTCVRLALETLTGIHGPDPLPTPHLASRRSVGVRVTVHGSVRFRIPSASNEVTRDAIRRDCPLSRQRPRDLKEHGLPMFAKKE